MKKFLKYVSNLAGKLMFWLGIEIGKKDQPLWQIRFTAGIEREGNNEEKLD
jgi:hypothetical protein